MGWNLKLHIYFHTPSLGGKMLLFISKCDLFVLFVIIVIIIVIIIIIVILFLLRSTDCNPIVTWSYKIFSGRSYWLHRYK
jgi:hypothetical protein